MHPAGQEDRIPYLCKYNRLKRFCGGSLESSLLENVISMKNLTCWLKCSGENMSKLYMITDVIIHVYYCLLSTSGKDQ